MISYFRINDPFRIVGLLILLALIRIPMMVIGTPLTIPELHWMLIGERMGNGYLIYRDIWDSIAPLSAVCYWLIDILFGKSVIAFQVISAFIVLFQSVIFNRTMRLNDVYLERTYVPGLIYIAVSSIFFDFFTLSPVLLGVTFLIIPLRILFQLIREDRSDESILKLGFYTGIAALFHFPLFIFILLAIFCLLLFTGIGLRSYLLLLFGFLLPVCLVTTFFFWFDAAGEFYRMFIGSFFSLQKIYFLSYKGVLILLAAPAVMLLFALFKVLTSRKFQNYQVKCRKIMFFWLILATAVCYFSIFNAPFQIIIFIPAVAFFGAHYFLLIKRRWITELTFFAFFLTVLVINYRTLKGYSILNIGQVYIEAINIDKLLVKQTNFHNPTSPPLTPGPPLIPPKGGKEKGRRTGHPSSHTG
ncbi:MAG: hypothetical protein IIA88_07225, partial [Bacteroidetes bacterium]|nr:hypothetical protein [Bacteroidota bacterium]